MSFCRFIFTNHVHFKQFTRNLSTTSALYNFQKPYSGSGLKKEKQLRQKDGLSDEYRIVYQAPMKTYAQSASIVSFGSLLGFGAYSSWKVYLTMGILGLPINNILDEELTIYAPHEIGVTLFGLLAINLALWRVASLYALRIYCNENEDSQSPRYCCIMSGLLPLTTRKIEFQAGDLRRVTGLGAQMPWSHSYYTLGSSKLILLENYFRTPADFYDMRKR